MIMLFEDKESSGISKMIKYAYSKFTNPRVVEFAGGNRNIVNCIRKLDDGVTTMFVYVDVMPGNIETVSVFNDTIDWVAENCSGNVYVLPIPCIEFYVISAFLDRKYKEVATVLDFNYYIQVPKNHRGKELSRDNFESYCKPVINNYLGCLKSKGEFYDTDCECNRRQDLCGSGDLYVKSWKLVGELPVFVTSSKVDIPISTKLADVSAIRNRLFEKYRLVVLRYITLGLVRYPESVKIKCVGQRRAENGMLF